jgi:hypothetical protein
VTKVLSAAQRRELNRRSGAYQAEQSPGGLALDVVNAIRRQLSSKSL